MSNQGHFGAFERMLDGPELPEESNTMTPTEQVIAAAREVLAAEEQRLRFKVALPDSLRHKDWELVKQFPARHLAAWGALISALAALDAEAPQPAIVNKFGDTLRPEVQRFMVEAQAHLSATPPTTEKDERAS